MDIWLAKCAIVLFQAGMMVVCGPDEKVGSFIPQSDNKALECFRATQSVLIQNGWYDDTHPLKTFKAHCVPAGSQAKM